MRSLRRALAARFSLTMFLALALIALWAFLGTHRRLSRQLDESLASDFRLQAAAIIQRLPIAFHTDSDDLETFVRQVNRFVTVWDSARRIIAGNTAFAGTLPVDSTSFERALRGELAWHTQSWATHRIRSLYAPAPRNAAGERAVIQVGASLEPLGDATRNILFFMVGTVLLGTVATFFGAGWLADSAVGPVEEITDQARDITAGTSSHRITAHADVVEFQGLVHVLNGMLARLDGAMQAQRRIISDVGHDLRTPITVMTGQLEVALRSERTPEQYRQVLSSCLEEALHMGSIGDALVMLARLEAEELRPETAVTDLVELVRRAIEHATPRAGNRLIVLHAPPLPVTILADSGMLRLVIDHLLDNTIQHTPDETRVEVSIEDRVSHVAIAVEDNGPGMPPDQLPLLFERFYRRDSARPRSTGAGLSLTIAAAIVSAHGGLIEAEQSALGGLKIAMHLPRTGTGHHIPAPTPTDEDPTSG